MKNTRSGSMLVILECVAFLIVTLERVSSCLVGIVGGAQVPKISRFH